MTAAASDAPLWAPPPRATAAPVDPVLAGAPRLKMLQSAADPRGLSAALMVGLILVVGFRHPVTRAIGTAGSEPPALATTPATKAVTPSTVALPREVPDTTPVRLHAPRDPFAPLAKPPAAVAGALQAAGGATVSSGSTPSTPSSAAPSQTATTYRVRPGDSLWVVAQRTMTGSKSVAAVATAWRQIYADNRGLIGNDPGVLQVGVVLSLRSHKR
jgi:LysM repeat protein